MKQKYFMIDVWYICSLCLTLQDKGMSLCMDVLRATTKAEVVKVVVSNMFWSQYLDLANSVLKYLISE